MLHESAKLLSQAIAMKPMSLLAIGQLGNTYLLHGELKLRISRQLRRLLSRSDDFGTGRQSSSLEDALPNRDRIATLLGNVCEECEELLVEAGRKYRTALAIDGNDLRALYNWGLALSFRAQLIADIGPVSIFLFPIWPSYCIDLDTVYYYCICFDTVLLLYCLLSYRQCFTGFVTMGFSF